MVQTINVCDKCPYAGKGTADGDCILAGLCCYGIRKNEETGNGGQPTE